MGLGLTVPENSITYTEVLFDNDQAYVEMTRDNNLADRFVNEDLLCYVTLDLAVFNLDYSINLTVKHIPQIETFTLTKIAMSNYTLSSINYVTANVTGFNFHNDSLYLATLPYTDDRGNTLIIEGKEAISLYNVESNVFAGKYFIII